MDAISQLDAVRGILADGEHCEPPQLRTDLLSLHQLAMDVVHDRRTDKAQEFFDLAGDLESQVSDMLEALEAIFRTLNTIIDCFPESLVNGE